ncbi:sigma-70 family RNA polymerase sigma factor [Laspinema sp. C3]|uniref:Sigma-70 family RNA polymerase sigma factor n=2 Tax=Laspinema TaxID=2584823 RepID=A0ABT2NAV3_9CYAN|nr:sigma-70 family RNA polymerase sigma factor [Laspinema sp. D3b]
MNGNLADAEDALSQAMLKAWEKIRDYASTISNVKAWLTQLTHNLCVDILRQRNRGVRSVENLETINATEDERLATQYHTPDQTLMQQELADTIRGAIGALPLRLRQPFILYLDEELSYREIAVRLGISYDNVRKRISQARAILRKQLNEYLPQTHSKVLQSPKRKKSRKTALPEAFVGETLPRSGEVENEIGSCL